jgi:hypothetical protein
VRKIRNSEDNKRVPQLQLAAAGVAQEAIYDTCVPSCLIGADKGRALVSLAGVPLSVVSSFSSTGGAQPGLA